MFLFREILFNGFLKLERWIRGKHDIFVVRTTDSVSGLIYDEVNDRVLLIRQGRAAMVCEDNPDGLIVELVAGRFDVNLGTRALLAKESKEEAGVTLDEDSIVILNGGQPMAISPGFATERCYLAFAVIKSSQVDDHGDTGRGEATEGEDITRFWMRAEDFCNSTHEDLRVFTLMQYLTVYRSHRKPRSRE